MARDGTATITYNASSAAGELVPDLIAPEIAASSAREEVFMPHVRRFDFTGPGEAFAIPHAGTLDWGALGSQTYLDGQAPSQTQWNPTSRSVTPVFYCLDVALPLDVLQGAQPGISVQDGVIKEAGIGLAKHHDGKFALEYDETSGLTSAPDHILGANSTPLSFTTFRAGYAALLAANAPRPYVWIVHPTQIAELLTDSVFIDAGIKGSPVLTRGVSMGGYLTSLLDVGIYSCDQIVESTGLRSMMMSTQALAYAYKRILNPSNGQLQELMVDVDWDSGARMININMTYQAIADGAVFTSSTNKYIVDIAS